MRCVMRPLELFHPRHRSKAPSERRGAVSVCSKAPSVRATWREGVRWVHRRRCRSQQSTTSAARSDNAPKLQIVKHLPENNMLAQQRRSTPTSLRPDSYFFAIIRPHCH